MGDQEEPGSDKVTGRTRAFEEIDAQIFPGPGRGATPAEAAASEWWGGSSPAIVESYRHMFDLVIKHQRAQQRAIHRPGRRRPITSEAGTGSGATTPTTSSRRRRSSSGTDVGVLPHPVSCDR